MPLSSEAMSHVSKSLALADDEGFRLQDHNSAKFSAIVAFQFRAPSRRTRNSKVMRKHVFVGAIAFATLAAAPAFAAPQ